MGGSSSPAAVPERMRRAAGEAAQHLSSTSGLAGADDWVKVPRNVASHHALKLEMDMQQQSCEKILCDELILLKKMLLKHQASGMNHDAGTVEEFIETRAQQSIDEDLDVIISDLVQVKGTHPHHRITAYAQLFAALNAELQSLVFTKDRQRVADMQGKVKSQQEAHRAEAAKLNLSVATKQKEVELLLAEKEDLRIKCAAAEAEALHWKRELGKTGRSQEQAHQDMVELRMQGIDFKSEVNRRSLKVLHSIQSRMGFVPSGVQKQVLLLNMLRVRHFFILFLLIFCLRHFPFLMFYVCFVLFVCRPRAILCTTRCVGLRQPTEKNSCRPRFICLTQGWDRTWVQDWVPSHPCRLSI